MLLTVATGLLRWPVPDEGKSQVIGIDIEIRPHNRKAIEAHELSPLITLVEGSSPEPDVVNYVE